LQFLSHVGKLVVQSLFLIVTLLAMLLASFSKFNEQSLQQVKCLRTLARSSKDSSLNVALLLS